MSTRNPSASGASSTATPTIAHEPEHPKVEMAEEIVVDWDGPDDPENPRNWSRNKKWAATLVVSSFTLISPVSSSMIAPATAEVADEFSVTNQVLIAMMTSIFVLAYAIGPLFLGPLSEIYGRNKVLQLANLWYLIWNLVCGFAQTAPQLLVFRFLAGFGGSAPLAVAGAVLGDIWAPEERGQALAIYSLAPLLGPVVGPVCGAFIAQRSTWRWVFWSTSIFTVGVQILGVFYIRESYAPLLLERRAARLRKSLAAAGAEGGHVPKVKARFTDENHTWKTVLHIALSRPFIIFYHEPIIQLLGVYMAFIYGVFYIFLVSMPPMFQNVYHESVEIAGLHYLALGIGVSAASQTNARAMDWMYRTLKERRGGVGEPEYRLPSMYPGTIFLPVGLLMTGWGVQAGVHWIVPDIGIALVGAGIILNFQSIQIYIVDAFALYAASALACVGCLRSLCGFAFPLFAQSMYDKLGYGKGDTILAVLAVVIGCPAYVPLLVYGYLYPSARLKQRRPVLFWRYGKRIRGRSKFAKQPDSLSDPKPELAEGRSTGDDGRRQTKE